MTQSRFYSNAQPTSLAAAAAATGNIQVNSVTGWPSSYPFVLLIDWGSFVPGATQEAVSVTSAPTGGGPYTVPCTRGYDSTGGSTHVLGASVVLGVTQQDFTDSAIHVNGFAQGMAPAGITGATSAVRFVGGTASGAPVSGTFVIGDYVIARDGNVWVCTTAGSPGTWTQAGGAIDGTASDIQPSPGTRAAGSTGKAADAGHVHGQPSNFAPSGLTGATAASRYVGATSSAAPVSGTFAVGDFVIDQSGFVWVCTVAGTPGTWAQAGGAIDGTASDIQPSPGTRAAGSVGKAADAGHIHGQPAMFAPTGLTGATAASRYVGATASGAPLSGTFAVGDHAIDQTGTIWVCTGAGTPGSWTQVVGGSGSVPGGAAGGDLGSNYPNPTVLATHLSSPLPIAQGGSGQATQQAAIDALTGTQSSGKVLRSDGAHATLAVIQAADLPAGTTSAQGALQLDGTASDILPSPGTRAAGAVGKPADAAHVHGQPSNFAPTGLTGATSASRYVGATASGAPVSGTFITGDFVLDQSGTAWICTTGGSPGTWTQIVGGAGSIPGGSAGGDLTGTYPSPTVGTNKISNAKAAQMAAYTFKANNTNATANAADLTTAQAASVLGGQLYALPYALP